MKQWTYDKVGNITMSVGERTDSLSHRYGYGYDALDRLVSATQFYGLHSNSATDTLAMSYDDLWRVTCIGGTGNLIHIYIKQGNECQKRS